VILTKHSFTILIKPEILDELAKARKGAFCCQNLVDSHMGSLFIGTYHMQLVPNFFAIVNPPDFVAYIRKNIHSQHIR
jgi:hypothetical protein